MLYKQTTIQMTFQHPVKFTEVLSDDVVDTEAALEGVLSTAVMELYGGIGVIIVKDITVQTSPTVYLYDDDEIMYRAF